MASYLYHLFILIAYQSVPPTASLSSELIYPNERFTRQSTSLTQSPGSCELPPHPQHGKYVGAQCTPGDTRPVCQNTPGTPSPHWWVLKYICDEGYDLTSSESDFSICANGEWKSPLSCIKQCPPLRTLNVDVRCSYNGLVVPCDRPMRPNTTATLRCRQYYRPSQTPDYNTLTCLDTGDWNHEIYSCVSDCGISTPPSNLILDRINDGASAELGEFPWLTALFYRNESNQWVQRCGGTLISAHIVLTAAHCLFRNGAPIAPGDVKVGLGKFHSDYYRYEKKSVVADVARVVTPPAYKGSDSLYALDIGVIVLAVSVPSSKFITPACMDWNKTISLGENVVGHVAGWGATERRVSSDIVLSAKLKYIDFNTCVNRSRQVIRKTVTPDKFCAEDINAGQVDSGDSGGGLTVVRNDLHFVFGVVSTKITLETSFTLFTDLTNTQHHSWLKELVAELDAVRPSKICLLPEESENRRFCPVTCDDCSRCSLAPATYVESSQIKIECEPGYRLEDNKKNYFMSCDDGTWSSKFPQCITYCGISTGVEGSKEATYPWLAALFFKSRSDQWEQQCAGTLITPHLVLTAAHCLVREEVMKPEDVKVGLGKYYRDYNKYENNSILADVKEVMIPPYYDGSETYYTLDIGLLDLAVSVQVTSHIMPACVDWTNGLTFNTGDVGHLAAWGFTANGTLRETVLLTDWTYLDRNACTKRVQWRFTRFITHEKFCAESLNGSINLRGSSGAGMTVFKNNLHFVIGIVSTGVENMTFFTDLKNAQHHKWLEDQKSRLTT